MTKKTAEEKVDQIDEASAIDTLKPNSQPTDSPRSKLEAITSVVSAAGKLRDDEWASWYENCISNIKTVADSGKSTSDSNKSSINNKSSKAEGTPGYTPAQAIVKIAKEEVDSLFSGEALTEEARETFGTLFEAAINARAALLEAELEERYEEALQEEIESFVAETKENLDAYVEYAVENWFQDNEVAVVDSLRLENAENFMEGLKSLFVESYIDVPEDRLDVVQEVSERVVEVEEALSEEIAKNAELKTQVAAFRRDAALAEAVKGLTLVDAEKVKKLAETIDFDDKFGSKVQLIKETYVKNAAKPADKESGDTTVLNETDDNTGETQKIVESADPLIRAATRMLNG